MATTTAAARRAQDKHRYDVMLASCPSRQLLDVLSDKWVSLVLAVLSTGSRRHSELRRDIAGVSQKMLTQTLRGLERDGLLARTVTASVPVRVDYELTALGQDLARVIGGLKTWAEEHMDEVLAAREKHAATLTTLTR